MRSDGICVASWRHSSWIDFFRLSWLPGSVQRAAAFERWSSGELAASPSALHVCAPQGVCVRACVRVCVRVCVRAYHRPSVRGCVRVCVRTRVCASVSNRVRVRVYARSPASNPTASTHLVRVDSHVESRTIGCAFSRLLMLSFAFSCFLSASLGSSNLLSVLHFASLVRAYRARRRLRVDCKPCSPPRRLPRALHAHVSSGLSHSRCVVPHELVCAYAAANIAALRLLGGRDD